MKLIPLSDYINRCLAKGNYDKEDCPRIPMQTDLKCQKCHKESGIKDRRKKFKLRP
jgi:hypothetical protein